jgi:hypothetical protein
VKTTADFVRCWIAINNSDIGKGWERHIQLHRITTQLSVGHLMGKGQ